ncbi:2OG-Fe(II) oxygenase family protein [Kutzneria sp. NPDC052558]|uniref:2OG-Fe(II) oxygenase family protein n=1 Tax=Kutzneria sp. NPDC052558 TaxID=3364121 RepID=UPI0037CC5500
MTDREIALIDVAAAEAGDAVELARLRAAGTELGIIQVVNHGVPQELVDDFHTRVAAVLALPRAEKVELASPTGHPYRGWRQWPDDFGRLELERYSISRYDSPAEAEAAGLPAEYSGEYAHPNVWPAQDPGLREVARAYHDAAAGLAQRVLGLYARVLDVAPEVFPVGAAPHHTSFTVNNYPTWTYGEAGDEDQKLLLLEHADGSALTVLHQRGDYEGLQGQWADGSWTPVPIVPGALQVFTGSLLTRWTNGKLRAGRHRVVAGGTVTRLSSGVFWHPRVDTIIEPLAPFVGADEPEYDPVLLWDTVRNRVEDYLAVFGRPEQVAAWRDGRPYVAAIAE